MFIRHLGTQSVNNVLRLSDFEHIEKEIIIIVGDLYLGFRALCEDEILNIASSDNNKHNFYFCHG